MNSNPLETVSQIESFFYRLLLGHGVLSQQQKKQLIQALRPNVTLFVERLFKGIIIVKDAVMAAPWLMWLVFVWKEMAGTYMESQLSVKARDKDQRETKPAYPWILDL